MNLCGLDKETCLTLIQSFYFRMFCVNSETFLNMFHLFENQYQFML